MAEPDPTRIVADVDVLAVDLLVGGDAREALDLIRAHSWLSLLLSEALLDEAVAIIGDVAGTDLARQWRERVTAEAEMIEEVGNGHPALELADAGEAATVLSLNPRLQSAAAGAAIRPQVATSVKSPDAFVRLLDPGSLYETVRDAPYPGTDRDPRD